MTEQPLGSHPIADSLPAMSPAEYDLLRDSIGRDGLQLPIILFEGLILDGRHRNKACDETGTPKRFDGFEGTWDDAVAYALGMNLARRNLSVAQRAMTAAKLANLRPGRPEKTVDAGTVFSQTQAGERFGVSRESVNAGAKVLRDGIPELVEAVEKGDISLTQGAAIAGTSCKKQKATLRHKKDRIGSYAQRVKVEDTLRGAKRSNQICPGCNSDVPKDVEHWLAYMHFMLSVYKEAGEPESRQVVRYLQSMIDEVEEMNGRGEYHSLSLGILDLLLAGPQGLDDLAIMLGAAKDGVKLCLEEFEKNGQMRRTRQGGKTDVARGGAKMLWELTPKGRIELDKLHSSILTLED